MSQPSSLTSRSKSPQEMERALSALTAKIDQVRTRIARDTADLKALFEERRALSEALREGRNSGTGPRPRGNQRQSVLLLVTDETARRFLARTVERTGRSAVEASSISEALVTLRRFPVDLALADIDLADGTALHFVEALREAMPHRLVPCAVMTVPQERRHIVPSAAGFFQGHLVKPVQRAPLLETLRDLCDPVDA